MGHRSLNASLCARMHLLASSDCRSHTTGRMHSQKLIGQPKCCTKHVDLEPVLGYNISTSYRNGCSPRCSHLALPCLSISRAWPMWMSMLLTEPAPPRKPSPPLPGPDPGPWSLPSAVWSWSGGGVSSRLERRLEWRTWRRRWRLRDRDRLLPSPSSRIALLRLAYLERWWRPRRLADEEADSLFTCCSHAGGTSSSDR